MKFATNGHSAGPPHWTYRLEGLLLLFQLPVDLGKLLLGLVELVLNGLDLLLECTSLFLEL